MQHSRRLVVGLTAVLALTVGSVMAMPAQAATPPKPGDQTIVMPIGDDVTGATYDRTFTRAYAGTTPTGTPVYIYVPEGTVLNGGLSTGVPLMDPTWDPDPTDEYVPCQQPLLSRYLITQQMINYLGDTLKNRIVANDEAFYAPISPAKAGDPNSKALVMLVYNVIDDMYYDCSVGTYIAGYFAPNFIDSMGMNVIVVDTLDWTNRLGDDPNAMPWSDHNPGNDVAELYEGVVAHELQHLLHSYADADEDSWLNEGLSDLAIFLNGFYPGGSHVAYHQVFYADTSLTRWGGGLENYGASYTFFQYLWERAGGNGNGTYNADQYYNGKGGDLLIKMIFNNPLNGMDAVQDSITKFNKQTGAKLPDVATLFQDWILAVYLDDPASDIYQIRAIEISTDPNADSWGYTMDLADIFIWGLRGFNLGPQWLPDADPDLSLDPEYTAVPYGIGIERFYDPGNLVKFSLNGQLTGVAPHSPPTHWYGGYVNMRDSILDIDAPASVKTMDFWTWYFMEEGWDFAYAEALVNGEWVTMPLINDAGVDVTTDDPGALGTNAKGNGLTGTSGGEYFVDDPVYIHLTAQVPAGATDVRMRYTTDPAYMDTGIFVDDVKVNGAAATLSSAPGQWSETTGKQDDHWAVQILSMCDLTPKDKKDDIVDSAGYHLLRLSGTSEVNVTLDTRCNAAAGPDALDFIVFTSNMPGGAMNVLDAKYTLKADNGSATNNGNGQTHEAGVGNMGNGNTGNGNSGNGNGNGNGGVGSGNGNGNGTNNGGTNNGKGNGK